MQSVPGDFVGNVNDLLLHGVEPEHLHRLVKVLQDCENFILKFKKISVLQVFFIALLQFISYMSFNWFQFKLLTYVGIRNSEFRPSIWNMRISITQRRSNYEYDISKRAILISKYNLLYYLWIYCCFSQTRLKRPDDNYDLTGAP